MGGYVTNTRRSPGIPKLSFLAEGIDRATGNVYATLADDDMYGDMAGQTTSSYRSGGDLEEDTLFRGGTLGSSIQAIKTYDTERGTSWDNGHTFNTVKSELELSHPDVTLPQYRWGTYVDRRYRGPLHVVYDGSFSMPNVPSASDLNVWGTKAIQRVTPGNSPADAAQALIELRREGLPQLFGAASLRNRTQIARSAGEEYLNAEFGWKPLVRDLVSTALAASTSEKILRDLVRGSGRHVRRRMSFPDQVSNTFITGTGSKCFVSGGNYAGGWFSPVQNNRWSVHTRTVRKISFSGAFTYYVPPEILMAGIVGSIERANHLFGLDLTPDLLWNITPWSWLSDWFFNIGDIISNLDNFRTDGTVMRYGYVMSETEITKTISCHTTQNVKVTSGSVPTYVTTTLRTIRKQRARATPYGFGLNPSSFTGRQWAILGALGMTRGGQNIRLSE